MSMRAMGSQVPLIKDPRWFSERIRMSSVFRRTREEVAMCTEDLGAIAGSWA